MNTSRSRYSEKRCSRGVPYWIQALRLSKFWKPGRQHLLQIHQTTGGLHQLPDFKVPEGCAKSLSSLGDRYDSGSKEQMIKKDSAELTFPCCCDAHMHSSVISNTSLWVSEEWSCMQAGDDDGSCYLRPMTPAELDEQSRAIQAAR